MEVTITLTYGQVHHSHIFHWIILPDSGMVSLFERPAEFRGSLEDVVCVASHHYAAANVMRITSVSDEWDLKQQRPDGAAGWAEYLLEKEREGSNGRHAADADHDG